MTGLIPILAAMAVSTVQPRIDASDDAIDAESSVPSVAEAFEGEYRYIGGEQQRRALHEAIDDVVDEMSVFVRGIARDRLVEGNPVPPSIVLQKDAGNEMLVSLAGYRYRAPIGGDPVPATGLDGDPVRYKLDVQPGPEKLEQHFIAAEGMRLDTFERTDGGVVVQVRVSSEKLPKPLEYRLTYRRIDEGAR